MIGHTVDFARFRHITVVLVLLLVAGRHAVGQAPGSSIHATNAPSTGAVSVTLLGTFSAQSVDSHRANSGMTSCESTTWVSSSALVSLVAQCSSCVSKTIIISYQGFHTTSANLLTLGLAEVNTVLTNQCATGSRHVTLLGTALAGDKSPKARISVTSSKATFWQSDSVICVRSSARTAAFQSSALVVSAAQSSVTSAKSCSYDNAILIGIELQRPAKANLEILCPAIGLTDWMVALDYRIPLSNFTGQTEGATTGAVMVRLLAQGMGESTRYSTTALVGQTSVESTHWKAETAMICRVQKGTASGLTTAVTAVAHSQISWTLGNAWSYRSPLQSSLAATNGPATGATHVSIVGFSLSSHDSSPKGILRGTTAMSTKWTSDSAATVKTTMGVPIRLHTFVVTVSPSVNSPKLWPVLTQTFSHDAANIPEVGVNRNVASTSAQSVTLIGGGMATYGESLKARTRRSSAESSGWVSTSAIVLKESRGTGFGVTPFVSMAGVYGGGTSLQAVTADRLSFLVSATRMNAAVTASQSVTVISRDTYAASIGIRVGSSAALSTLWISTSTIRPKVALSFAMRQRVVGSADCFVRISSMTNAISFDLQTSKGSDAIGAPSTGGTAVFLAMTNQGERAIVCVGSRIGVTNAHATMWKSDTGLQVKVPAAVASLLGVVTTILSYSGDRTLRGVFVNIAAGQSSSALMTNMASTGGAVVTVTGVHYGSTTSSNVLRVGRTSALLWRWNSDSSIACRSSILGQLPIPVVSSMSTSVLSSSNKLLTFDTQRDFLTSATNGSPSGATSVTVVGRGFGSEAKTLHVRRRGSASDCSQWISDSTLFPRYTMTTLSSALSSVAITVVDITATTIELFSIDNAAIGQSGLQPQNVVATGSISVTLLSNTAGLIFSVSGITGETTSSSTVWSSDTSLTMKHASTFVSSPTVSVSGSVALSTIQIGVSFDLTPVVPSNLPATGSSAVSVVGANIRLMDLTPDLRFGKSSARVTKWVSDSVVQSKTVSSATTSWKKILLISIDASMMTSLRSFSVDVFAMSSVISTNSPLTGTTSVTVITKGLNQHKTTEWVRVSTTSGEVSTWTSETSTTCKISHPCVHNTVTVSLNIWHGATCAAFLSSDIPRSLGDVNTAATAASTVTVVGSSFGSTATTLHFRMQATSAPMSNWLSSTALVVKPSSVSSRKTVAAVVTILANMVSLHHSFSYDSLSTTLGDRLCSIEFEQAQSNFTQVTTGSTFVTLVGKNFGKHASAQTTFYGSKSESSQWVSQTSVRAKQQTLSGITGSALFVTVSSFTKLHNDCKPVFVGDVSTTQATNTPHSGSTHVTIVGSGLMWASVASRTGASAAMHTTWVSDSSVTCHLATRSVTNVVNAAVVITASKRSFTAPETLSFDFAFWRRLDSSIQTNSPATGAVLVTIVGSEYLAFFTPGATFGATQSESVSWISLTAVACKTIEAPFHSESISLSSWFVLSTLSKTFTQDIAFVSSTKSVNSPITGSATVTMLARNFGVASRSLTNKIGGSVTEASFWLSSSAIITKSPTFAGTDTASVIASVLNRASPPFNGFTFDFYSLAKVCTVVRTNLPSTGGVSITLLGEFYSRASDDAGESFFKVGRTQAEAKIWYSASSLQCRTGVGSSMFFDIFASTAQFVRTTLQSFTYNSHTLETSSPLNTPATGSTTITLIGLQFNILNPSQKVRFRLSSSESTLWISETSLRAQISSAHASDDDQVVTSTLYNAPFTVGTANVFDEIWSHSQPTDALSVGGTIVTVFGARFLSTTTYFCDFTMGTSVLSVLAVNVVFGQMHCLTPNWGATLPARVISLGIRGNNIPIWGAFGKFRPFKFTEVWIGISPTQAYASGGTTLLVSGNGFDSVQVADYSCIFTAVTNLTTVISLASPATSVHSSVEFSCLSPVCQQVAVTNVTVSRLATTVEKGHKNSTMFRFFDRLNSVYPTSGTAYGGHPVFFFGNTLRLSGYTCRFSSTFGNATAMALMSNSSVGSCIVPGWGTTLPNGATTFTVFHEDDFEYGNVASTSSLSYTFEPEWEAVVPSRTIAAGGAVITILGSGFSPSDAYTVQMTGVGGSTPCSFVNTSTLRFVSPNVGGARSSGVETLTLYVSAVSLLKTKHRTNVGFPFAFEETILSVHPVLAWAQQTTALAVTITGTGFSPSSAYTCRFVAPRYNTTLAHSIVIYSRVICPVPQWGLYAAEAVSNLDIYRDNVLVSSIANTTTFEFDALWFSLQPSSADISGGSEIQITGAGFDIDNFYVCSFVLNASNATSIAVRPISSTQITFVAPEWKFDLPVNSSLDHPYLQIWNTNSSTMIPTHDGLPHLYTVIKGYNTPTFGTVGGGTSIEFYGSNFDTCLRGYFCRFSLEAGGHMDSISSSPSSSSVVRCDTPGWDALYSAAYVQLQVYLQTDSELIMLPNMGSVFRFVEALSYELTEPTSAPSIGGDTVTIRGSGFRDSAYECRFYSERLLQTSVGHVVTRDPRQILCTVPHWIRNSAETVVTIHDVATGEAYGTGFEAFSLVECVTSVWPTHSFASGGSMVNVSGAGFGDILDASMYECVFRNDIIELHSVPVKTTAPSHLLCPAPAWGTKFPSLTIVTFSLIRVAPSANNVFQTASLLFSFTQEWSGADALSYRSVGMETFAVFGYGFDNRSLAEPYICVFSVVDPANTTNILKATSIAIVSTVTQLICPVPVWNYPASMVTLTISQDGVVLDGPVFNRAFVENVISASSTNGNATGGHLLTFSAMGLQTNQSLYRCVFTSLLGQRMESTVVSPASPQHIQCVTPAWGSQFQAQATAMTIENNGQTVDSLGTNLFFEFIVQVFGIDTTMGSAMGGTTFDVLGSGFPVNSSLPLQCFFIGTAGAIKTVWAFPSSPTSVTFVTPNWGETYHAQVVVLEIKHNGVTVATSIPLRFSFQLTMSHLGLANIPASYVGPLDVYGSGLSPTHSCVVSMSSLDRSTMFLSATYVSVTHLVIQLPGTIGPWDVNVDLTCNSQLVGEVAPVTFFFIGSPKVSSIIPSQGATGSAMDVTIIGKYFGPLGSAVSIRIGSTVCSSPTYIVPESQLKCTVGPWSGQHLSIVVTVPAGSSTINETNATYTYLTEAPTVEVCEFRSDGRINIVFEVDMLISSPTDCWTWFKNASVVTLGLGALCSWSGFRQMSISLGSDFSLLPGHSLSVQDGMFQRSATRSYSLQDSIIVSTPSDGSLIPSPILTGPEEASVCDAVVLSAQQSTGGAGKPLHFTWEYLSLGNFPGSSTPTLWNLVSVTFAAHSLPIGRHSWRLTVTNVLGIQGSRLVHLDMTGDATRPIVSIRGPQVIETTALSGIFVFADVTLASCLDVSVGSLLFSWTLRNLTGSVMFASEGSNLNSLYLPSNVLQIGDSQVHLSVIVDSIDLFLQAPVPGTSSVDLSVSPTPLVACIDFGNRTVSANNLLQLTADCSTDPEMATFPGDMSYTWDCIDVPGLALCATLALWPQESKIGVSVPSPLLKLRVVDGPVTFSFSLSVSKTSHSPIWSGSRRSTTFVDITIAPESQDLVNTWISSTLPFKVNSADYISVSAATTGRSPIRCAWTAKAVGEELEFVGTGIASRSGSCTLVLLPNLLDAFHGERLRLRVLVQSRDGTGTAYIQTNINAPPAGGNCFLSPQSGAELTTDFFLSCDGWQDVDLPLSYGVQVCAEPIAQCATSQLNLRSFGGRLDYNPVRRMLLPSTVDGLTQVTALIADCMGAVTRMPLFATVTELPPLQPSDLSALLEKAQRVLLKSGSSVGVNFIHVVEILLVKLQDLGTARTAKPTGRKLLSANLVQQEREFRGELLAALIEFTRPELQSRRLDGLQEIIDVLNTATRVPLAPMDQNIANSFVAEILDELQRRARADFSIRLPIGLLTRIMRVVENQIDAAESLSDASISTKVLLEGLTRASYRIGQLTSSGMTLDELAKIVVGRDGLMTQRVSEQIAHLSSGGLNFSITTSSTDCIVMVQNFEQEVSKGLKIPTTHIFNISAIDKYGNTSLVTMSMFTVPLNNSTRAGSSLYCGGWDASTGDWDRTLCSSTSENWPAWEVTCECNGAGLYSVDIVYRCSPSDPTACNSHGACVNQYCQCDSSWTGLECEHQCDPCENGICLMDKSCRCNTGFFGVDCSANPRIFSVTPTLVPTIGGLTLTITGQQFGSSLTTPLIRVGKTSCGQVVWRSSSILECVVSVGTGDHLAVAVLVGGQSSPQHENLTVAYEGPHVMSISPTTGPTNGGTLMSVFGRNFGVDRRSGVQVSLGGIQATTIFVSDSSASWRLPQGVGAKVPLTVRVEGQISNEHTQFGYYSPSIHTVMPAFSDNYRDSTITVIGKNIAAPGFESEVSVYVGNNTCTVFTVEYDQLVCNLGVDDGVQDVIVITGGQTNIANDSATYEFIGMIAGLVVDHANTSVTYKDPDLADGAVFFTLAVNAISTTGKLVTTGTDVELNPVVRVTFSPIDASMFGLSSSVMVQGKAQFLPLRFNGFPGRQYTITATVDIKGLDFTRVLTVGMPLTAPKCKATHSAPFQLPDMSTCYCDRGFGIDRAEGADTSACLACDEVSFKSRVFTEPCNICPDLENMETFDINSHEDYFEYAVTNGFASNLSSLSGAVSLHDCKCKVDTWRNVTVLEYLGDNDNPGALIMPAEGDEALEWYSDNSVPLCAPCPLKGACLGDYGGQSTNKCKEGHEGVLCATCEVGRVMDKVLLACVPCPSVTNYVIMLLLVVIAIVMMIIFGAKIRFLISKLVPAHDMKLITSYIVVIVQMKDVYDLKMPPEFTSFLLSVDLVSKMDFGEMSYCTSGVRLGFYSSLTTKIVLPFSLLTLAALAHLLPPLMEGIKNTLWKLSHAPPEDEEEDPNFIIHKRRHTTQRRKVTIGTSDASLVMKKVRNNNVVDVAQKTLREKYDMFKKKYSPKQTAKEASTFAEMVTSAVLIVLTALHSFVTSTIFQLFQCHEIIGYELKFLKADYSLRCQDSQWILYVSIGMTVVLVFTFGFPFSMYVMIRFRRGHYLRARANLTTIYSSTVAAERSELIGMARRVTQKDGREQASAARARMDMEKTMNAEYIAAAREYCTAHRGWMAIKSLHGDYKPAFVYWEVLEIMRKFLMTSFIVFVVEYMKGYDLIVGTMIALTFCFAQVNFKPYRAHRANFLQFLFLGTQLGMLFVLLLLTLSKNAANYNVSFIGGTLVFVNIFILSLTIGFNAIRGAYRLFKQGVLTKKIPTIDDMAKEKLVTERQLTDLAIMVQYKWRWLKKRGVSLSAAWREEIAQRERDIHVAEEQKRYEQEARIAERMARAERNKKMREDTVARELRERLDEPDDLVQLDIDSDNDVEDTLELEDMHAGVVGDFAIGATADAEVSTPLGAIPTVIGGNIGPSISNRDVMQDGMEFDYSDDDGGLDFGLGNGDMQMELDASDTASQFSLIIDDGDEILGASAVADNGLGVPTVPESDHEEDW